MLKNEMTCSKRRGKSDACVKTPAERQVLDRVAV